MSRLAGSYALVTTLLWGVWGALAGLPGEHGLPETLNYVVWALTMIPPAVFVLRAERTAAAARPALGDARASRSGCWAPAGS